MTGFRGIGVLAAAGVLVAQSAFAAPNPPTIVLEAHVGVRTSEVASVMASLLDELERHGFAARPETIERLLGNQLPHPGILDGGKTSADIAQQIASGLDAFHSGRFKEAEAMLLLAAQQIKRNPALIVLDTTNAKVTFSAFVGLALAQAKLGHAPESVATMTALLRMSETPISRSEYGPQAEQFYRSVQKQVEAMGGGSLTITVTDGRAMIFLDGQFRGMGKASLGDLIPGAHDVFVQVPGSSGRQYETEVRASHETALDIDWQVDATLHAADPWVGFVFATEAERAKEASYAGTLARRWHGNNIVVVGTVQLKGTPIVIGTVYPANRGAPRGGFVPMNGGGDDLRALARFLLDGTVSGRVRVFSRGPGDLGDLSPSLAASASGRRRSTILPRLVSGAGALAIVAGGVVYVASKADDFTMPTYHDRRSPAVGVVLCGSVVLGAGVYLWLRESTSSGALASAALGAGVGSLVAGGMLYVTDEDPHREGWQRPFYRDTATTGLVAGAAGVAMTGLGLWRWRHHSKHVVPVVSASSTHTVVGWATRF